MLGRFTVVKSKYIQDHTKFVIVQIMNLQVIIVTGIQIGKLIDEGELKICRPDDCSQDATDEKLRTFQVASAPQRQLR